MIGGGFGCRKAVPKFLFHKPNYGQHQNRACMNKVDQEPWNTNSRKTSNSRQPVYNIQCSVYCGMYVCTM